MLIVYAASSNVSIVQLYAGALFPGLILAGLYMIYVVARAWLNPTLAPKPAEEEFERLNFLQIIFRLITSFFPLAILILSVLGAILFASRPRPKRPRWARWAVCSWRSATGR